MGRVVVLANGAKGAEGQCYALVDRMGVPRADIEVHAIELWGLFRWLPPFLHVPLACDAVACLQSKQLARVLGLKASAHPLFEAPFPMLVVGSGRTTAAACAALKHLAGEHTTAVQIQHPRCCPSYFDYVITPEHDSLKGTADTNVLFTHGSLHGLMQERLRHEFWLNEHLFLPCPDPCCVILIGGPTKRCHWTSGQVLQQLRKLTESMPVASFYATTSRRTPQELGEQVSLALHSSGKPAVVWEGSGTNPYPAMLYKAAFIAVTADSANMVTEAVSTGKPTIVLCRNQATAKLESEGSTRTLDSFVNSLEPELHSSVAVDDTGAVAALVAAKCNWRRSLWSPDPSVFNQT